MIIKFPIKERRTPRAVSLNIIEYMRTGTLRRKSAEHSTVSITAKTVISRNVRLTDMADLDAKAHITRMLSARDDMLCMFLDSGQTAKNCGPSKRAFA
jgi:hypothetical protein